MHGKAKTVEQRSGAWRAPVTKAASRVGVAAALLLTLTASSCFPDRQVLGVTGVQVQLAKAESDPAIGSFTVHGGPSDVRLLAVQTPSAVRAVLVEADGKTEIPQAPGIPIAAGSKVVFGPGQRHLRLERVNRVPRATNEIELTFLFSNGARQWVEAPVKAAE